MARACGDTDPDEDDNLEERVKRWVDEALDERLGRRGRPRVDHSEALLSRICTAYQELRQEYGVPPTQPEVSDRTGIALRTIQRAVHGHGGWPPHPPGQSRDPES
jgi:hypothetical protein